MRGTSGAGCSFDSTRSGDFSPFSLTVPAACTSLQFSFVTDSTVVRSGVFVRAGPLGVSPSVAPRAAGGGAGGGAINPIGGGAIAGIVIGVLIAAVVIPVLICVACCGGVAGACAACARGKAPHQPFDSGGANTVVVMQNPVGLFAGHSGGLAGPHGGMPPLSQPVYDYSASHAPSFSYPPPAYPPPAAYPPPQHPHFSQYPPPPQSPPPPPAQHQPFYPPPPSPHGNAV